jgi:hypothetical protein
VCEQILDFSPWISKGMRCFRLLLLSAIPSLMLPFYGRHCWQRPCLLPISEKTLPEFRIYQSSLPLLLPVSLPLPPELLPLNTS